MEYSYQKEAFVLPSMADHTARLGVPNIFALFMDLATLHAEELGFGPTAMMRRGLFWLTVKTKIRIHDRPGLMERITVRTWPGKPERYRCLRYYEILRGDELLVEGKTEWAVLNTQTGALTPADVIYPNGLDTTDRTACDGLFARINVDFSTAERVSSYTVRSTDIDLGRHMNNAAYLRAVFGTLPTADLDARPVREADALFKAPCYEGETLSLLRRCADGALEYCAEKPDGKTAFLLRLA